MKLSKKITLFKTISSTNDYIKEHISTYPKGVVLQAIEQSKGRGRFGNAWNSLPGNLYFSFLHESVENIFDLHITVSVILIELLEELGIKASIKYPNDIIVNNRKIAGILIETKGYLEEKKVVVGVGLNVLQKDFYELNNLATSISLELNKTYAPVDILHKFIDRFNKNNYDLYDQYIRHSIIIGKEVNYKDKPYIVKGIKRTGNIILVDNKGEITVGFDSISFSSIYQEISLK